ncbi:uncharacterized protein [Rutidosis leptorrhynchoides]|uniref:uncharacterized protein n=1 Tax=Rutidosis leptorrhynchoides TaxID=125765 RepID=UPI003A996668
MNTWKKYGVEKIMMNAKGFFFFKFATKEGMIHVMQNGSWMIQTIPIILNVWSPNVSLTKEDLTKMPVWVRLHDVSLADFTEIGLSVIASKIGKPMMLDTYTSTMCLESWGHPNFARAMIEVSATDELKEYIKLSIPVEPIKVVTQDDDGFIKVTKKQSVKVGDKSKHNGFQMGKSKQTFVYRSKQKQDSVKINEKDKSVKDGSQPGPKDEESDIELNMDETSKFMASKKDSEGISNNSVCRGGTRIIVGWDPGEVQVICVNMTDQVIHCAVRDVNNMWQIFVSVVSADNYYIRRRLLWNILCLHKRYVGSQPWILMGDFNVSLDVEDSTVSSSCCTLTMHEFRECVDEINMLNVNHSGFHYTWNQRPNSLTGIFKKIDRVMGKAIFISMYANAHVIFQPYRISDHCPAVIKTLMNVVKKSNPFKFSNCVAKHGDFRSVIAEGWKQEVHGHTMYRVVKKLRLLKKPIRKLMWSKGNLHDKVIKCRGRSNVGVVWMRCKKFLR